MADLIISMDSRSSDLVPLALAINQIVGLPVTLRSSRWPGVRVEKGAVLDDNYSGPVLEEVIELKKPIRTVPKSGPYKGVPVSVAPIVVNGEIIAAVGVVDAIGTMDLPEMFSDYIDVVKQVSERK